MPFQFKVWNQGNDQQTMGIRIRNVAELARFARVCSQPDLAGAWPDLGTYLSAVARATTEPPPYSRLVQVIWLNTRGYGTARNFPGRTLVVTYSGLRRKNGGFASQGYCIVDAQGYPILGPHHQQPIQVEYIADRAQDILIVLP